MEPEYDIVVIGAGLTGSLTAWKMAEAGRKVLILEAGEKGPKRVELVGAYVTAPRKTMGAPYRGRDGDRFAPSPDGPDDYYDHRGSPSKFRATYQRRVGGATWHWRGNVPRLVPNDFRLKTAFGVGVDWPITYDDLEPLYCEAERLLGTSGDHDEWQNLHGAYRSQPFPMDKIWPAYGDLVVARRLQGRYFEGVPLRVMTTPQARNSRPYDGRPACAGNSTCDPICPIGAKFDATQLVRLALAKGVHLRDRSVVTALRTDSSGRVCSVAFKTWDGHDQQVQARVVVLAAHTIETAKILLLSATDAFPNGLANSSDQVGRNLMDHLQGQAAALLPEPVFPFRGPPTTSGIDSFRDGAFRALHAAFRMSIGNDGWGLVEGPYNTLWQLLEHDKLVGGSLRAQLADRITRQLRISYSTETLPRPNNRVTLSDLRDELGIPHPRIHFELDQYNRLAFATAIRVIAAIFQYLAAVETKFPSDPNGYSSANHIMGTTRMGTDPRTSVVNTYCRSHDHENLYILGGSVFPTCGTANPSLTIVALTLRAIKDLERHPALA